MADHNFLVDDISQRKPAEKFRKSFIDSRIFILGFDLSLETINMVDLFGFVVAASHMQDFLVRAFPSDQGEHALN